MYLRDLFPVAFHDDGADVGFRDLLPLDAFHLPHGVAGGGNGLYPAAGAGLIKKGLKSGRENTGKKRFNLLDTVQAVYTRALTWTFRFPKATIGLGVLTVALAILMITQLSQRMMPIADRDQFAVEIYLPQGTSLDRTAAVSDSLYKLLSEDERILSVTSFIGTSSPRFQATYAPNLAGKNYAQFIVNTASVEATRSVLDDYTDRYADYFPDAYVKFKQLDYQTYPLL